MSADAVPVARHHAAPGGDHLLPRRHRIRVIDLAEGGVAEQCHARPVGVGDAVQGQSCCRGSHIVDHRTRRCHTVTDRRDRFFRPPGPDRYLLSA